MSDPSAYRQAAAECLEIASSTNDADARTRLILLAGKFLGLASKPEDRGAFRVLLDEFNDAQMRSQNGRA